MALKFRRGTTAQKSGSLAFGEPYVNTDLNTLMVGGAGGDITLSSIGTGSNLTINDITASGNISVAGNVSVAGQLTIGDATSDTLNVVASLSSSLIPSQTNVFDLGSASKIWRDLYISTGSIKFTDASGNVVRTFNPDTLTALESSTGSSNVSITNINSTTASLNTSVSNINNFTSSENTKFSTLGTYTSSVETRMSTLATLTGSNGVRLSNIETTTASLNTSVSNINTYTSSLNTAIQLTGSTVSFLGNIVVYGTQSVINSTNVEISDNILYLAPTASIDNDLGIVGHYNDGTYRHAGIFMDASDGHAWKVFNGLTGETNATIDTAGTGFTLADFKAGVITGTSFNGTINATNGVVSGSSQVIGILSSLNSYTASNDTTNTTQNTSISNLNTTTASLNTSVSNLNTYTGSFAAASVTLTNKTIAAGSNTISGLTNANLSGTAGITNANLANSSITIAGASTALGSSVSAATIGNAIGAFSGSSQVSGITNAQLVNSTISGISLGSNLATLTIGTGLSGTSYNGSAAVTIANTGVTSITGTSNQVNASASTGGVTLSLPQSIHTAATPTFAGLTINGAITATGDITAYYSSDRRYKNTIQTIPNALDKVKKLNGVTWEWNDDVNDVTKAAPTTGLIAQEVQEVLPQVVKEKEDGYLGLDYAKMMGLLVEAIKEQQIQIEDLKLEIADLKKQKGL